MKKSFKTYLISWLVLVALFNVVSFAIPGEVNGLNKYGGAFWSCYVFIMLSFILHLVYAYFAMKPADRDERIRNASLLTISSIELAIMVVIGSLAMAVPNIPNWVGIIVCAAVLAFSVLFLISAKKVGETTSEASVKLNARTERMRGIIDQAQLLSSKGKTETAKSETHRVFEAIRYSDIGSYPETAQYEDKLEELLSKLAEMVKSEENDGKLKDLADEILEVVEQRNNECRVQQRKM